MIKFTLFTLIILLIGVIATSYYVNKEGFDNISNSTPRVTVTTNIDDVFLNINANTTDGSTIYGAKILYNSSTPVLSPGQSTDSTLAFNLVISPTPFTIYNKPLSFFQKGFKYYIVTNDVSSYVEGTTPLLGSFIFNNSSSPSSPAVAPSVPSAPSAPSVPSIAPSAPSNPFAPFIPTSPTIPVAPSAVPSAVPSVAPSVAPYVPASRELLPGQQSEIVISGSGFDAMTLQQKSEILKDVQQLIKNELISQRQTTPINSDSTANTDDSESTQQGKEFNKSCKKNCEGPCPRNKDGTCPPVPDMSQYIRKDQIPCWNCTLDY